MKKLEEYTANEIELFDQMHRELTAYNEAIRKDPSAALDRPLFTRPAMAAYSRYRELLSQEEAEANRIQL